MLVIMKNGEEKLYLHILEHTLKNKTKSPQQY